MEKRKIVFYLTIGMILILHLTACANSVNFGVQAAGARTFSRTISEF